MKQGIKNNEISLSKCCIIRERAVFIIPKPQNLPQYKVRERTPKGRQKIHEPLGTRPTDAFKYPIRYF